MGVASTNGSHTGYSLVSFPTSVPEMLAHESRVRLDVLANLGEARGRSKNGLEVYGFGPSVLEAAAKSSSRPGPVFSAEASDGELNQF